MRRLLTITLAVLALAGCGASAGPAEPETGYDRALAYITTTSAGDRAAVCPAPAELPEGQRADEPFGPHTAPHSDHRWTFGDHLAALRAFCA